MSWADDIRARVNIADVVADYARLKPSGPGKFVCLSPFKQETRPSFNIDANKGVWYCFSTKQGGDIVKFIMLVENLEFKEALEFLGHKYGIPEPERPKGAAGGGGLRAEGKEALYKAYEAAATYYQNILLNTSMGASARAYLEKRGVKSGVIRDFKLGATPGGRDMLCQELLKKGVKEKDLELAGLASRRRDGTGVDDRFRNRLIFPIANHAGRIHAFGGRALDDDPAKYINSANSPIYNKSEALYGLSEAKKSIAALGYAILVEGYMDVLALVQAGFENAVATCGTALTELHLKLLFRHTRDLVISMDGDGAGRDAAVRTAGIVLAAGVSPKVVQLPGGIDPDDFIKKHGREKFAALIESAVNPVRFLMGVLGANSAMDAKTKEESIRKLAPIVIAAPPIVKSEFIREIASSLSLDSAIVQSLIGMERSQRASKKSAADAGDGMRRLMRDGRLLLEAGIIAGILANPNLLKIAAEKLTEDDFSSATAKAAWRIVSTGSNETKWDAEILALQNEIPEIGEFYGVLIDDSFFPHHRDFRARIDKLVAENSQPDTAAIERKIVEAEAAGDYEKVAELAAKLYEMRGTPGSMNEKPIPFLRNSK